MDNGLPSFSGLLDIFNALPDAVVIANNTGSIVLVNTQAETLFGYTSNEFMKMTIESLMPLRFRDQHIEHRKQYSEHPTMRQMNSELELFGLKKDNTEFPIEVSLSPLHIDATQLTLAIIRDITVRMDIEKSYSLLNTVVKFSDDAIIGKDLQGIITNWNAGAEKLYGYAASEVIGQSILILFTKDAQEELEIIMRKIKRGESLIQFESLRVRKDGKILPTAETISPVYNNKHEIIAAVTIARNISEQRKVEAKLQYFADHDTLTGLITHVIFKDRIVQSIARAKRYQSYLAVCFIDLDDFKKINDTYGHDTGDKLLAATVDCIQACLREIDTIARVGGDEFALLLLEITDAAHAIRVIKKIMHRFEKPIKIQDLSINVSLSIGMAIYPDDGGDALLEKADAAMYYVKKHGKNNFKLFDKTCPYRPQTENDNEL